MTWPDGLRYEGEWSGGEMHGQGVLTRPGGTRHEGRFFFGVHYEGEAEEVGYRAPHGQGVMTWPDGKRYEGEFRDGEPVGD